jgi:hypothetical protein
VVAPGSSAQAEAAFDVPDEEPPDVPDEPEGFDPESEPEDFDVEADVVLDDAPRESFR